MRPVAYWIASGILTIALASGCGRKTADAHKSDDGHEHAKVEEHKEGDGHNHGEKEEGDEHGEDEKAGVAFKEGRGIQLSPEIIKALGLTIVEASEQPLAEMIRIGAQVFDTKPQVLATASMPNEEAARLEKQSFTGAKMVRIDRTAESATRLVEVIFAVEQNPPPKIGDFITLSLASEPSEKLVVPRTAILDGAAGTFVYVVNGEFYLRTAVTLGSRSADLVEITDGLYSGDMVVVSPVEQLWLAELRLTKGGGHSH